MHGDTVQAYRGYTIRYSITRAKGCAVARAFPYCIEASTGVVLMYASSLYDAKRWIDKQAVVNHFNHLPEGSS